MNKTTPIFQEGSLGHWRRICTTWHWYVLLCGSLGKSTVIMHVLRECYARQWSAKLLTPTGALRESYVQHGVHCEVDTFDGGTAFGRQTTDEFAPLLLSHDIWIVDEVFNLRQNQWDFLVQAWSLCGRWPCLLFCGDPQQLRPWNDDGSCAKMCVHSARWRFVKVHYLHEPFRCDRQYFRYTMYIRCAYPDNSWLEELRNRCSLDESHNLDEDSVRQALDKAPGMMFLACSKNGVAQLNNMVAHILYKDQQPRAQLKELLPCRCSEGRGWSSCTTSGSRMGL